MYKVSSEETKPLPSNSELKKEFKGSPYFQNSVDEEPLSMQRVKTLRSLKYRSDQIRNKCERILSGEEDPFFVIPGWEAEFKQDPDAFSAMFALAEHVGAMAPKLEAALTHFGEMHNLGTATVMDSYTLQ